MHRSDYTAARHLQQQIPRSIADVLALLKQYGIVQAAFSILHTILFRKFSMLSKALTVAVLLAVSAAHAQTAPSPLSFRTVKIEAKSCHGKDQENKPVCHESEAVYPITGDRHLDNWVRKQFHGTLPTQRSVQTKLNRDEDVKYANETNPQKLREYGDVCRINEMETLELEGYTPRYAVFKSVFWEYQCGPHGNASISLIVLKRGVANPKALELKDILLPGQKARLVRLLKEAYIKDLMEGGSNRQQAQKTADRPNSAYLSADWRFGKDGIIFAYQSGDIGDNFSYPEVTLSPRDLQGVIKGEILREIGHYRKNPAVDYP